MTRISLVRAAVLAGLVAGCTVVYPNGTAVITHNNTAGTASPEPWPSRTPSASRFSEAPPPTGARSFAGKGPNLWVGPLVLPAGRTSLTVRFTAAIEPGGVMHEAHLAFIQWARGYDQAGFPGRSLERHRDWLANLTCPVLEIDGTPRLDESVERVLASAG